ncbi:MAG: M1 family aminopeptidase [Tannerellaceae bacterium]|nr:M1 family aminopeptidase [Tannerellaceae bacterium]
MPCAGSGEIPASRLVPGISRELARFRKKQYQDIHYELFFSLPETRTEPVTGQVTIRLKTAEKTPVIVDFRPDNQILSCQANGHILPVKTIHEHLVIPMEYIQEGDNCISLSFIPSDQSLNRREDFMYTLLVPDRARTLFPCFDQPDLKALYTLSLEIPANWQAIANSSVMSTDETVPDQRKLICFRQTEPLSTYLFFFCSRRFQQERYQREGREIAIYHRETDLQKIAQCPEIASEVLDALEWLEEYTRIPYPFAKYDLIILPGFQYGGMEHTGATLYNDRRMFLHESPTLNEQLSRSALIAHETAHMWFGDYVTMEWFDDVWTKEVFANYFASLIVEPLYPEVDHRLNFILDYIPAAYAEDRTAGSNPVKQELDNLKDAGLVYGNIIYNKSPVVMEMLVQTIGTDAFRRGIQEYLQRYAYGNADWDSLIRILEQYTPVNLSRWSHMWIYEKGMPELKIKKRTSYLFPSKIHGEGE